MPTQSQSQWGMSVRIWCVVVVACICFSGSAQAQALKANISGRLTDNTGAVVGGATVTVTNSETGVANMVKTDEVGRYLVPNLNIGTYEVGAEITGFKRAVHSGVNLTVGAEAVVDFVMEVGDLTQTIDVQGE